MSRMTARLILLGAALSGSGCGTVANLAENQHIYGGTGIDVTSARHAFQELAHPDDPHEYNTTHDESMLLVSCSDLPLSVMADTFTLPVTCYCWLKERLKRPETSAAAVTVHTSSAPPAASVPLAKNAEASHGAAGSSPGPVATSSEKPAD
jgi:uncharacterized protein YceK